MLSRSELDEKLAALAQEMPAMLQDPDGFFRAYEDRLERILSIAAPEDQVYALEVLEAFVERSGINRAWQG